MFRSVAGKNRAHTWPVGDVICARAEFRKLAAEQIQQTLRSAIIEALYCVVSKINELLKMRASSSQTAGRSHSGSYIEQASAGAHHEPCLVKVGDTGGIVVWLSVGQMRARIRHVHHGGKFWVPRAPLHGSYLVHNCSSGRVRDTSDVPHRPQRWVRAPSSDSSQRVVSLPG